MGLKGKNVEYFSMALYACACCLFRYPADKKHQIEMVKYPGAGHLLEPPYNPHCKGCINPTFG
jgi:hypothetical protein